MTKARDSGGQCPWAEHTFQRRQGEGHRPMRRRALHWSPGEGLGPTRASGFHFVPCVKQLHLLLDLTQPLSFAWHAWTFSFHMLMVILRWTDSSLVTFYCFVFDYFSLSPSRMFSCSSPRGRSGFVICPDGMVGHSLEAPGFCDTQKREGEVVGGALCLPEGGSRCSSPRAAW